MRETEQEEGWKTGYCEAQSHGHAREAGRQTKRGWLSFELQAPSQAVRMLSHSCTTLAYRY